VPKNQLEKFVPIIVLAFPASFITILSRSLCAIMRKGNKEKNIKKKGKKEKGDKRALAGRR
jgi:hypothetical protein